ncbi:MAG TPA: hypothetical protein VJR69_05215, partial [Nitrospira sp.]|nr:hypothetical protein [Nitrospira sp.]
VFYALLWQRQAFQDDQGRQNRIEAVGEDLLVIAVTSLHAEARLRATGQAVWDLADEVLEEAGARVKRHIRGLLFNDDKSSTAVGTKALTGSYPSLSTGIIQRNLEDYREAVGAEAPQVEGHSLIV